MEPKLVFGGEDNGPNKFTVMLSALCVCVFSASVLTSIQLHKWKQEIKNRHLSSPPVSSIPSRKASSFGLLEDTSSTVSTMCRNRYLTAFLHCIFKEKCLYPSFRWYQLIQRGKNIFQQQLDSWWCRSGYIDSAGERFPLDSHWCVWIVVINSLWLLNMD